MAEHEGAVAQLHQEMNDSSLKKTDMAGGTLVEKGGATDSAALPTYSRGSSDRGPDYQTPDGEMPTEHEKETLLHVGESLPLSTWLIAVVELCERFTYYGVSGLFQNYIQKPYDGPLGEGALGLKQQGASGLSNFFQFWCYVTPIIGAIIADQYLGRYKTILIFACVYMVGLLLLTLTSLPIALSHGAGLGGFIPSIIIIGLGTGGIKSNVSALIADQYTRKVQAVHTKPNGERVILDPGVTYQRIYMIFYASINIGSLSLLATPFMERDVGFWSAFLLGLCMFIAGTSVLILAKRFYVVRPPQGSIITDAFRAIWIMIISRNMDAPKPSYQAQRGGRAVPWSDHFIEELKRALTACKIFVFFPVFWVIYNQFSSNFVSQALEMSGHGIPNDLMQNFDPISIIVVIPILDRLVFPLLRKLHIPFKPISRITVGFLIAASGMIYAGVLQYYIYKAPPCFDTPLACDAGLGPDGEYVGNDIHIAIQTPAYILIGIAEVFLNITGLEYAYTKAPASMKSFVQSIYLFTTAFGAILGIALTSVAADPTVQWMYLGLGITATVTAGIFWTLFHHLNAKEDEMNALSGKEDKWNHHGGAAEHPGVEAHDHEHDVEKTSRAS